MPHPKAPPSPAARLATLDARLLALCDAPEWIRAQSLVRIGLAFASVDAGGAVLLVGAESASALPHWRAAAIAEEYRARGLNAAPVLLCPALESERLRLALVVEEQELIARSWSRSSAWFGDLPES